MNVYFAYGSNLNHAQMAHRCPTARPIGRAILHGYKLEFKANARGVGVANITPARGHIVQGGLWEITRADLRSLDSYEGHPTVYARTDVEVICEGHFFDAITYIMGRNFKETAYPEMDYLNRISVGFDDFGLDHKYLDKALPRFQAARSWQMTLDDLVARAKL